MNTVIRNNAIGTNSSGTLNLGNGGSGILINGTNNTSVGGTLTNAGNTIAFNGGDGVKIQGGDSNPILRNSMFNNTSLGINLVGSANNNQAAPTLTTVTTSSGVTTVKGTLQSTPNTQFTIELFSNTAVDPSGQTGEGRTFVGSTTVTTDSQGMAAINATTQTQVALNNYVLATATDPNNNTSEFSNPVQNVAPSANLSITGTASPNPVPSGAVLTYTFTITNAGPNAATNVTFNDTLPTGFTFTLANATQGTVTQSGSTVTANIGTMQPNSTVTVMILGVPAPTGTLPTTISNTAQVSSPEDTMTANNSATVQTMVVQGSNLLLTVTATPNPATVNDRLAFEYVITNQGTQTANGVTLTSNIPANFQFVEATSSQGTTSNTATNVTAAIGDLAPNASARVMLVGMPTATGTVTAMGTVTATQPTIFAPDTMATQAVTVNATPTNPIVDQTGPTVTGFQRFGFHTSPTSVVLTFNEPLDPTTAENLSNYQLTTPSGANIPLSMAIYDPTLQSVTLVTQHRLSPRQVVLVNINGMAPSGVTDLGGNLLDGANNGMPGSNFVGTLRGFQPGVAGTTLPTRQAVLQQQALAHQQALAQRQALARQQAQARRDALQQQLALSSSNQVTAQSIPTETPIALPQPLQALLLKRRSN